MENKLKNIATIIGAILIIGGGTFGLGSRFFVSSEEAQKCHEDINKRVTAHDMLLVEMRTDMKYIKEAVTEIKNRGH